MNKKKLVTAQRKKYATQQDLKTEMKREKELEVSIADKESQILDLEDKIKAFQQSNEKMTIANEKLKEKLQQLLNYAEQMHNKNYGKKIEKKTGDN